MFDVLADFESNDHFFLTANSELEEVFNAPKSGLGVYLVYELKNGRISLVYVGAAGKIRHTGSKKGKENFSEEFFNGQQFGGRRPNTWRQKLINDKIDALDIYWYETYNIKMRVIPSLVQALVIQAHFEMHGKLPPWNEEF